MEQRIAPDGTHELTGLTTTTMTHLSELATAHAREVGTSTALGDVLARVVKEAADRLFEGIPHEKL